MATMQSMPTRTSERNHKYQYLIWAIRDVPLPTANIFHDEQSTEVWHYRQFAPSANVGFLTHYLPTRICGKALCQAERRLCYC